MRPRAMDRSRLHIPRHPQPLGVSPVPHLVQLADGDVVALPILHAGVSEITEQEKNHDNGRTELQISLALTGHKEPPHRDCAFLTLLDTKRRIKIREGRASRLLSAFAD